MYLVRVGGLSIAAPLVRDGIDALVFLVVESDNTYNLRCIEGILDIRHLVFRLHTMYLRSKFEMF